MDKQTLLATYYKDSKKIDITVEKYEELVRGEEKAAIAEFIFNRFHSRYLKPFEFDNNDYKKKYKNGFSIMANCCLLIEVLESFRNGWETTDGKGKSPFESFFLREEKFEKLREDAKDFYKDVRCGILHQAETKNGWKITRKLEAPLFNKNTKKELNATKFMKNIKEAIGNYSTALEKEEWDSELWDNLRRKMRSIIRNC